MYTRKTKKCDDTILMSDLVENFLSAKPKKRVFGNFRITDNDTKLVYESQETLEFGARFYYGEQDKAFEDPKRQEAFDATIENLRTIRNGIAAGTAKLHQDDKDALEQINAAVNQYTGFRIKRPIDLPSFKYSIPVSDTIALKLSNGLTIGNSSILPNVGKTVAYGNTNENRRETVIQRLLSDKIPMIPFNVFEEADLDLQTLKIVDQTGAETVTVDEQVEGNSRNNWKSTTREVNRHFTGATIFECDGKQFLFDVDRNELKHKIFNAFLVELPSKVSTVSEAYESLKPSEVKDALKQKLDVKRQGEWFFIPCEAPVIPELNQDQAIMALLASTGAIRESIFNDEDNSWRRDEVTKSLVKLIGKKKVKSMIEDAEKFLNTIPKGGQLKVGNNRPNAVEKIVQIDGVTYATGTVSHTGREHKDLKLNSWHRAVPNTAVKSFTIIGDVD